MENKQLADKFLQWVNDNYDNLKQHHQAYCLNTKQKWNEDIFSDTYIKIYEKILKDGIKDDSPRGMECYFFMAFKTNTKRENQYARNAKKDSNIQNLSELQEMYLNSKLTDKEKLKSDLFKDFSCIYLLKKIEQNFPQSDYHLFKLKLFENLTYKQLTEKTGEKGVRQRIVDIKNFLKESVSKEEIKKAFDKEFGDLIFES